jgi:hypothetical protein
MREIRLSGSEGGGLEFNRISLPLSKAGSAQVRVFCVPVRLFISDWHYKLVNAPGIGEGPRRNANYAYLRATPFRLCRP